MKRILFTLLMIGISSVHAQEIIGTESTSGLRLSSQVFDYDIIQTDQEGNILWRKAITNSSIPFDSTQSTYMVYSQTTIKNGKITSCPGDYDYWLVKRDTAINANVYPNPAINQLYVTLDAFMDNIQFELYDLNRKLIFFRQLNNYTTLIDLPNMANGIYTFKIFTTNKLIKTGKVCIMQNTSLH
jgi:hypothetical protein